MKAEMAPAAALLERAWEIIAESLGWAPGWPPEWRDKAEQWRKDWTWWLEDQRHVPAGYAKRPRRKARRATA